MPAPPLIPLTIRTPGYKGLNTEDSTLELDTGWAVKLDNCIFSDTGKISSRKGFVVLEDSGTDFQSNAPTTAHIFERSAGSMLITAGNDTGTHNIYSGTSTLTNISDANRGTTLTAPTASDWQFANFIDSSGNEKIIGFQAAHKPIVSNNGGEFIDIAGTAIPLTGNCVCAAFGRLWAVLDDGISLVYSSLLDETDWSTTGGTFKLGTYWPGGMDHATAITTWEDKLVVFGSHSVIIYQSPDVPTAMTIWDTIDGVGCVARDTVQSIGSDIVFLSESGLRSLRKTIVEGKVPLSDISAPIREEINYLTDVTIGTIKSVYSQREGFYLLIYPNDKVVYCVDTQNIELARALPEAEQIKISKWPNSMISCAAYGRNEITYFGFLDSDGNGQLATYGGYLDDDTTYTMSYKSPWIDLSSPEAGGTWNKIIKKATATITGNSTYTIELTFGYDFGIDARPFTDEIMVGTVTGAEYSASGSNLAEYGISEYGGSQPATGQIKYNVSGTGQHFQVGFQCVINGYQLSLQQIDVFLKRGRISR